MPMLTFMTKLLIALFGVTAYSALKKLRWTVFVSSSNLILECVHEACRNSWSQLASF